ncbi:MAG: BON domain-containing protein [Rubrobacteraceae bacterium]
MLGRTAKTALKTRTGRRVTRDILKGSIKAGNSRGGRGAAKAGVKGLFKAGSSRSGRDAAKAGARGFGKLAKTGAKLKAGKEAGKAGTKGAAKAGRGFGKLATKKGKRELRVAEKTLKSERSRGGRSLWYVLIALAGLGVVALLARSGSKGSSTETDDSGQPGSGAAAGDGADRAHSDPSSGPLIGGDHGGSIGGVTEDQPEVAQRIKTRIGEDERTRDVPRVNVEVSEGLAELRGVAPSDEAKDAAGEIAADTEGVTEVRNLIEVSS